MCGYPEEGIRFSGPGATRSFELPKGVLGPELQSSARALLALNHGAIFVVPPENYSNSKQVWLLLFLLFICFFF